MQEYNENISKPKPEFRFSEKLLKNTEYGAQNFHFLNKYATIDGKK